MRARDYIVIHHSATVDGNTFSWPAIREYHLKNGWNDIGYHWGLEYVNGEVVIAKGRPMDTPGAHVKDGGFNYKSIGICVVGNFDKVAPKKEILNALAELCVLICSKFNIPFINVVGHREAQAVAGLSPDKRKTCPGKLFDMDEFRGLLEKTQL